MCGVTRGGGANRLSLPPINSFLFPTPRVKKIALRAPTFPQAESQEMKWDFLFFILEIIGVEGQTAGKSGRFH